MIPQRHLTVADDRPTTPARLDPALARDLCFRVLMHLLEREDRQALAQVGLEDETLTALEGLTLEQLRYLARFGGHFLHLAIDARGLTRALDRVLDQQRSDQLQEELLRRQAPAAMMRSLFGMSKRVFIQQRRPLDLPPGGRPRAPTLEELTLLCRGWRETVSEPLAQRYLHLAEITGLSLVNIWAAREDFQVPLKGNRPF